MAKNIYSNINLNKNQLQNAVIQPLSAAPASPYVGQIYYDTTKQKMFICTDNTSGSEVWLDLGVQGKVENNKVTIEGTSLEKIAAWKGTFSATTAYAIGDMVQYGTAPNEATYICISAHAAGAWVATDFQQLGGSGKVQDVTIAGTSIVDSADNKAKVVLDNGLEFNTSNKLDVKLNATQDATVQVTKDASGVKANLSLTATQDPGVTLSKETDGLKATLNIAATQGTGVTVVKNDTGNTGIKVSVQDATTALKGITQLTSSIDTTDESKALDGKAITDLAVDEFALASVTSNVVTIKGIKEVNGEIAVGTDATKNIVLEEVAYTGKSADVSVDNSVKTYMSATVQAELEDVYTNEAVSIATATTPTTGSKRTYEVKQTGTGTATGGYDLNSKIEIPELVLTKESTATTGYAATYKLTYDGTDLATKIDIPKDWLLKYAWAQTVKLYDSAAGAAIGDLVIDPTTTAGTAATIYAVKKVVPTGTAWADVILAANGYVINSGVSDKANEKFLVLYMNVKDESEENSLILIKLTDLAPIYVGAKGIEISTANEIQHTNALKDSDGTAVAADVDTYMVPQVKMDMYGHIKQYVDFTPREKTTTLTLDGSGTAVTPVTIALPAGSQFAEAHCEDASGNEVICDVKVTRASATAAGSVAFSADNTVAVTISCYVTYFGVA